MDQPQSERSIFEAAIDKVTSQERAAFLEEACGANEALRLEVEALLAVHDRLGPSPPHPQTADDCTTDEAVVREHPGTMIGSYKLVEQIGEGGFGVVFMAEQQRPLRRKVAVKIIKPGMDSRQVIARFEAERQALALMDHPNIARFLDAGATDSGQPYFVMELVRGVPITQLCDEHELTTPQRLELFIEVCRAVQHAHQKGIIHRDLKPSNVLVTLHAGKPVVKVIDFGVAKAIAQPLTDKTLITGFAQLIGTPLYMSPEQAEMSGLDVDTRSDIYSLGVLLYELLTGTTPFTRERLREASFDEIRRIIREEEPPRPSTRISTMGHAGETVSSRRKSDPKRLSRLFRGELDWIVMKALEKDPARRYETVGEFAADLLRYSSDEPVQACPPSSWYRFSKFVRRHKGKLLIAGLILLIVVLLGGGAGWAARDRAIRSALLQAEVDQALREALSLVQAERLPEAVEAMKRAEAVLAGGGGDEALHRRVDRLRTDVRMAGRLADVRLERSAVKDGHFDHATADREYQDAFAKSELNVTTLDADEAASRLQASAIKAHLLSAMDDWLVAKLAAKLPGSEQLLAVLERADTDDWRNQFRAAFQRRDARALKDLASQKQVMDQPSATIVFLAAALLETGERSQAVKVMRGAQDDRPNDFWINHNLGAYLALSHETTDVTAAVGYLRAAVALRPDSPGVYYNLSRAFMLNKDATSAIAACKRAIALKPDYADAHASLGAALQHKGDLPGAIAAYRKAIELGGETAEAVGNLGLALHDSGDQASAIATCKKAIALNPNYAEPYNYLGASLAATGKIDEAIASYRKAIDLKPELADAHSNLGSALHDKGDVRGAIAEYKKAVAINPDFAMAHANLGDALLAMGDAEGAVAACKKAIALKPDFAMAHYNLGCASGNTGDLIGAIAAFRKTIAIDLNYADAHCNLASALQRQGKFGEALEEMRRGHEIGVKKPGWNYPSREWVRQYERFADLDRKLPSFVSGKTAPASARERTELASVCSRKKLNRAAVRFYEGAFSAQADLLTANRYNAACAAAMAGCGQGEDAAEPDSERQRLRGLALGWLRDEISSWIKGFEKTPETLERALRFCRRDPNFAGVREPEQLIELPPKEQQEWRRLWKEVEKHLQRAAAPPGKAAGK
jgi:serine/threonine protein kinase/tetratricopeptide (TPR) repeat protein